MAESHDVIVIGGGACGDTAALLLLHEGLSVALFDQGRAGREASWASAGIIGPRSSSTCDPWSLEATTLSRRLYDQLIPELQQIPATASVVTDLVLRRTLSLSTHQLGVERHLDVS